MRGRARYAMQWRAQYRTKYPNDFMGRSIIPRTLFTPRRVSMYDCKCRQLMCIRIDRTFTYHRFIWHDASARASSIVEQNRLLPLEKPMLHSDGLARPHSYVARAARLGNLSRTLSSSSFSSAQEKAKSSHRDDLCRGNVGSPYNTLQYKVDRW